MNAVSTTEGHTPAESLAPSGSAQRSRAAGSPFAGNPANARARHGGSLTRDVGCRDSARALAGRPADSAGQMVRARACATSSWAARRAVPRWRARSSALPSCAPGWRSTSVLSCAPKWWFTRASSVAAPAWSAPT